MWKFLRALRRFSLEYSGQRAAGQLPGAPALGSGVSQFLCASLFSLPGGQVTLAGASNEPFVVAKPVASGPRLWNLGSRQAPAGTLMWMAPVPTSGNHCLALDTVLFSRPSLPGPRCSSSLLTSPLPSENHRGPQRPRCHIPASLANSSPLQALCSCLSRSVAHTGARASSRLGFTSLGRSVNWMGLGL